MNNWHTEFMAEYNRLQIQEQTEKIQLEKLASRARVYHPSLFERTMFNLANWMISTGGQFRRRYEAPAVSCRNSPRKASCLNFPVL